MDAKQFGTWIKELRDLSLTRAAFARKYKRHANTIKAYENDGRLPDIDHLFALAVETGYDFNTLVIKRLEAAQNSDGLPSDIEVAGVCESKTPYHTIAEKAGLVQITIDSDSMAPTIMPGAAVVYDPLKTQLKDGHMYIFSFDNGMQVRRVQTMNNGAFKLICDNSTYPPQELDKAAVEHIEVPGIVTSVTNFFS